ncbi:hypothetical protein F4811DRAFT_518891 [Daldinia bambusicola]|nr:hypothetical protein F4811DRAFT_518891 [Daldinia bambusicola]
MPQIHLHIFLYFLFCINHCPGVSAMCAVRLVMANAASSHISCLFFSSSLRVQNTEKQNELAREWASKRKPEGVEEIGSER